MCKDDLERIPHKFANDRDIEQRDGSKEVLVPCLACLRSSYRACAGLSFSVIVWVVSVTRVRTASDSRKCDVKPRESNVPQRCRVEWVARPSHVAPFGILGRSFFGSTLVDEVRGWGSASLRSVVVGREEWRVLLSYGLSLPMRGGLLWPVVVWDRPPRLVRHFGVGSLRGGWGAWALDPLPRYAVGVGVGGRTRTFRIDPIRPSERDASSFTPGVSLLLSITLPNPRGIPFRSGNGGSMKPGT